MDQVYSRLYGKSRVSSTSPARSAVPLDASPVGPRSASAPSTASMATVSESTTLSLLPDEAREKQEWALWQQEAIELDRDARRSPHGVQLTVRTSLNVAQSIYAGSPPAIALTTKLVRPCLDGFRTALLLGRDWAHHGAGTRVIDATTMTVPTASPDADEGRESASRRAPRRMPDGLDEEARVLLLKLIKWESSAAAAQTQTRNAQPMREEGRDTNSSRAEKTEKEKDDEATPVKVTRATVESELLAWLVDQEKSRTSPGTGTSATHPSPRDVSYLLLSQQLRHRPLLEDLCVLARHILVPLDIVRHQHRWLFVNEDVSLTLRHRLHHHRLVLGDRSASMTTRPSDRASTTRGAQPAQEPQPRLQQEEQPSTLTQSGAMSADAVRQLWAELWCVLGAAWRQRDRLLGAYSRLHGLRARAPVQLPPSHRPHSLPPSGAATVFGKERYEHYVRRARQTAAAAVAAVATTTTATIDDGGSASDSPVAASPEPPLVPPPYTAEEDTCAFGPLTPDRIGVSGSRCYVIRDALAAVMRSLSVEIKPPSSSSPGAPASPRAGGGVSRSRPTSPQASPRPPGLAVFSAASTPRPSRAPSVLFDSLVDVPARSPPDAQPTARHLAIAPQGVPAAITAHGAGGAPLSTWATPLSAADAAPVVACVFDASQDDVAALAAPYLAPEWYVYVQRRKKQQHDQQQARLSQLRRRGGEGEDERGAMDAGAAGSDVVVSHCFSDDAWSIAVMTVEAALTSFDVTRSHLVSCESTTPSSVSRRSGSLFADITAVLTTRCQLPEDAACNFLYAALHFFAQEISACIAAVTPSRPVAAASAGAGIATPSPQRLAQEWLACVRAVYGDAFVRTTLNEVCSCGLQWRRAARWSAFVDAHARGETVATVATPTHITSAAAGGSPTASQSVDSPHSSHSPCWTGTVGSTRSSSARRDTALVGRAAQRVQRVLDGLQVPLLTLFSGTVSEVLLPASSGAATASKKTHGSEKWGPVRVDRRTPSSSLWWEAPFLSSVESRLRQWRACVESKAGSSRSHGGDEGEAAVFTAWVALSRRALLLQCLAALSSRTSTCTTGTSRSARRTHAANAAEAEREQKGETNDDHGTDGMTPEVWAQVRAGSVRYWIAAHPFIRRLIAGGHLSALRAASASVITTATTHVTCADASRESGDAEAVLSRLATLFIPMHTLNRLMCDDADVQGGVLRQQRRNAGPSEPPVCHTTDVGAGRCGRTTQPLRALTGLEALLGDHWRTSLALRVAAGTASSRGDDLLAGQARRAASARLEAESYYSIVTQAYGGKATAPRTIVATPLVRNALEAAMRPMDLVVSHQIECVAALRRRLLAWSSPSSSSALLVPPSPAVVARQLRGYLMAQHAAAATAGAERTARVSVGSDLASCAVPIPATLRATCWAALLQVPSARKREKLYQSLPLFQAALSDRQIALDVPRCHQYHPLLACREGRERLCHAIKAWLLLSETSDSGRTHNRNAKSLLKEESRLYWQGVDSVCAVLLTVAYTDEPLVVFLLDMLLQRCVPHQEEEGASPHNSGGAHTMSPTSARRIPSSTPVAAIPPYSPVRSHSMADQLAQLEVTLAYVDPLLAAHLFGRLDCRPGLFAISWFLTLMAHNLPVGQVYPLWDFVLLYVEDYPHCFVSLCCALLLAHREDLLSQDLSMCLTTLSRLASNINLPSLLVNTAVLMQCVPPLLRFDPPMPPSGEMMASFSSMTTSPGAGDSRPARVCCLPVKALVELMQRTGRGAGGRASEAEEGPCGFPFQIHWGDAGLFLVDLRPTVPLQTAADGTRYREYLMGALPVPVAAPVTVLDPDMGFASEAEDDEEEEVAQESGRHGGQQRGQTARSRRAVAARRLAEQRRHAALDFQRRIEEAAAEVARQVQATGVVMATVAPRCAAYAYGDGAPEEGNEGAADAARAVLTPMTLKTLRAPHIVLVGASSLLPHTSAGKDVAPSPVSMTDWDVAAPLGRQLVTFGVHKVSVLLGGLEAIKKGAPKLVVRVVDEANRASL